MLLVQWDLGEFKFSQKFLHHVVMWLHSLFYFLMSMSIPFCCVLHMRRCQIKCAFQHLKFILSTSKFHMRMKTLLKSSIVYLLLPQVNVMLHESFIFQKTLILRCIDVNSNYFMVNESAVGFEYMIVC